MLVKEDKLCNQNLNKNFLFGSIQKKRDSINSLIFCMNQMKFEFLFLNFN